MSFGYSGDPATSPKDEVRFLIGDTNDSAQLLQDEEINYLLNGTTARGAAIQACYALARAFARKVDKSVGDLRITYSNLSGVFVAQAKELRRRAAPIPVITGVSISDKAAVRTDPDRVPPAVVLGQDDYEGPSTRRDDPRWFPGGVL